MKRLLFFLVLAALLVGCDARPHLRSAKGLSTEPATWKSGPWKGISGTAVTIQFKEGTEQFRAAEDVAFRFDHGTIPHFYSKYWGRWAEVYDFTVPVMKREPHALTLFFSNSDDTTVGVLEELPKQIEAGTLVVIPCDPNRGC